MFVVAIAVFGLLNLRSALVGVPFPLLADVFTVVASSVCVRVAASGLIVTWLASWFRSRCICTGSSLKERATQ